jgi:ribonucleoside-diphosphate reductase alpha chain
MTKLPNDYQEYIFRSRYSRYLEKEGRRENWDETVKRYCDFFKAKFPDTFPYEDVYNGILNLDVMPSMRSLMTAGEALERDNMAGYNCSYKSADHNRSLDEMMYILLCGTGVGFSVERQFVNSLPEVPEALHPTETVIVVADSKIGWASAFRELVGLLYSGKIPKWDTSKVRPAGARLKVFGGRASGPAPLEELFGFVVSVFSGAVGRRLSSVEVHDIICKIADIVVVGGVRRSALLSLSNLTDERMQRAKMGQWWEANGQRALANNSVAYTEKPDVGIFIREWLALYDSKSGERGIFNRNAANAKAKANGRREGDHAFGTNPCGEIILRDGGLCNLSEVIVRSTDTFGDLTRKVELATIIGTFQSTLTDFRYVRPIWKKNAEEERLLGVSFTGIMDHPILSWKEDPLFDQSFADGVYEDSAHLEVYLNQLKEHAIQTNKLWANKLGINVSAAITTVKPSGTVSQLVDSASGIHPRYAPYYIRTVRADRKDPLTQFMIGQGFSWEPDVTKPEQTVVFSFPMKSPEGAVLRNDLTALQQLEHYLLISEAWCEHNPSCTIYVREHEWLDVQAWVYRNFDKIGGVSFLPHSDHIYRQAPYQEITKEQYEELVSKMPKAVDWTALVEEEDNTTGSQELACLGGVCEVI